jgi:hypothetical protein
MPFSHIRLQLATPSSGNRFCGDYVTSLINTRTTLEHFGAAFDWATYPGCSDLCHARNKILGNFMRKDFTHLLLIDDDMGWEAKDVVRMLSFDKDFIAGVGCKKKLPLEWCVSNRADKDGSIETLNMQQNPDGTYIAQPNYVGAGFVLMKRECCQRMIENYEDLAYTDPFDNQKEYGLYDPVRLPYGERYFDDFAFCYRWRQVGGEVNVLPDIHLKHLGNHTFEGAWISSMQYTNEKGELVNGK